MNLTPSLLRAAANLIATPSRFSSTHHAATSRGEITLPGAGDAAAFSAIGALCQIRAMQGEFYNVAEALRAWQATGLPSLTGASFLQSVYWLRRCAFLIEQRERDAKEEWRLAA